MCDSQIKAITIQIDYTGNMIISHHQQLFITNRRHKITFIFTHFLLNLKDIYD